MKAIKAKKSWVTAYEEVFDALGDVETLQEFHEMGEADEEEVNEAYSNAMKVTEALEFKKMLSAEEDQLSATMEINPGAGGTESNDWADILMRMYLMWGEKQGFKVKEIDFQPGEVAGLKSATLEFEGQFAYGYLKSEIGVHRLVRISPLRSP